MTLCFIPQQYSASTSLWQWWAPEIKWFHLFLFSFQDQTPVFFFADGQILTIKIIGCTSETSSTFQAWKQDLEQSTKERFVQRKGTKQLKDCAVSCLMCHHSGFYRDRNPIKNRRTNGTGKMQSHCSAFIDAYLFKKEVRTLLIIISCMSDGIIKGWFCESLIISFVFTKVNISNALKQ